MPQVFLHDVIGLESGTVSAPAIMCWSLGVSWHHTSNQFTCILVTGRFAGDIFYLHLPDVAEISWSYRTEVFTLSVFNCDRNHPRGWCQWFAASSLQHVSGSVYKQILLSAFPVLKYDLYLGQQWLKIVGSTIQFLASPGSRTQELAETELQVAPGVSALALVHECVIACVWMRRRVKELWVPKR